METDIKGIFSEILMSMTKLELLIFFSKNQYSMDTARRFSEFIKRPESYVRESLEFFVRKGIVEKMGDGETSIYSFTSDMEAIHTIEEFIKPILRKKVF
jgi:predicted transcriptional regulator of viral defense system